LSRASERRGRADGARSAHGARVLPHAVRVTRLRLRAVALLGGGRAHPGASAAGVVANELARRAVVGPLTGVAAGLRLETVALLGAGRAHAGAPSCAAHEFARPSGIVGPLPAIAACLRLEPVTSHLFGFANAGAGSAAADVVAGVAGVLPG